MSARCKAPPEHRRERRRDGTRLSLHVKRDGRGYGVPYSIVEGAPRWKFCLRMRRPEGGWRCQNIAAADWRDAEREADKVLDAWRREGEGTTTTSEARIVNALCDLFLDIKGGRDSATRPATVAGYRRDIDNLIRPGLGAMQVAAVTPDAVTEWKAKYAGEGKARTRAKAVNLLAMVLNVAVRRGWRPASPVLPEHRVKVMKVGERRGKLEGDQRVARALSAEELASVVAKLDADDPGLRLLVQLTGAVGFRLREVTHLRVEDVTLDPTGAAFITVASGVPCGCRDCAGVRLTKAGRGRLVPVPPETVPALGQYMAEHRARFPRSPWLFCEWRRRARQRTEAGALRVARTVSDRFQVAAEAAGLTGLVFHDLRSTAKTLLIARGGNVSAIDAALGHQLPGMSSIYVQLDQQPGLFYRSVFPDWAPTLSGEKAARRTA